MSETQRVDGIQGPAWWTGSDKDDGLVSADAARTFVSGGPLSLLARA